MSQINTVKQNITYPKLGDVVKNGFKVILDLNDVPDEPTENEYQEELAETNERPIGYNCNYTSAQLAIRLRLAKRFTKIIYKHALTHDKDIADCYVTHPPYMFYTEQKTIDENSPTPIRRLYGICVGSSGDFRAHAVSAMSMFNNAVIGGVPLKDMVSIDKWSETQMEYLNSGLIRYVGAFTDPLGFYEFLS